MDAERARAFEQERAERERQRAEQERATIEAAAVEADDLGHEYGENAAQADLKYKNRRIYIRGTVRGIGTSSYGYYVELGPPGFEHVLCYFSESDGRKLAQIRRGQMLTVSGEVEFNNGPTVYVKDSKIAVQE